MDEMDYAQQREQNDREIAIKYNKRKELAQIGSCYECSEPIARGNFCCPDCRETYEMRAKFNAGSI